MAACRTCGKTITFAMGQSGRNMPLQLDPEGDYVIVPPRTVNGSSEAVRIPDEPIPPPIRQEIQNGRRFKSHFADCPQANGWRKKR